MNINQRQKKKNKIITEHSDESIDSDIIEDDFDSAFDQIQNNKRASTPSDINAVNVDEIANSPMTDYFQENVQQQLMLLVANSQHLLASFAVIEKSLIDNGILASISDVTRATTIEQGEEFVKDHKLPLTSFDGIAQFNEKLKDVNFHKHAVS